MFVIVWRYKVKPDCYDAFEDSYGSEGSWVFFFRKGAGYVRTELFRNPDRNGEYLTLDYWMSSKDFEEFSLDNEAEYASIDEQYQKLTESEIRVGAFDTEEG